MNAAPQSPGKINDKYWLVRSIPQSPRYCRVCPIISWWGRRAGPLWCHHPPASPCTTLPRPGTLQKNAFVCQSVLGWGKSKPTLLGGSTCLVSVAIVSLHLWSILAVLFGLSKVTRPCVAPAPLHVYSDAVSSSCIRVISSYGLSLCQH